MIEDCRRPPLAKGARRVEAEVRRCGGMDDVDGALPGDGPDDAPHRVDRAAVLAHVTGGTASVLRKVEPVDPDPVDDLVRCDVAGAALRANDVDVPTGIPQRLAFGPHTRIAGN